MYQSIGFSILLHTLVFSVWGHFPDTSISINPLLFFFFMFHNLIERLHYDLYRNSILVLAMLPIRLTFLLSFNYLLFHYLYSILVFTILLCPRFYIFTRRSHLVSVVRLYSIFWHTIVLVLVSIIYMSSFIYIFWSQ